MIMKTGEWIELKRELKAIEIPSGTERVLPAGSLVRISQILGTNYTVVSNVGYMCRIEASDADALDGIRLRSEEALAPRPSSMKKRCGINSEAFMILKFP